VADFGDAEVVRVLEVTGFSPVTAAAAGPQLVATSAPAIAVIHRRLRFNKANWGHVDMPVAHNT
jgi:hypothetical protein